MMRELGLEVVRLAEFAWAKMEPAEGQFDRAWLDRAIETPGATGLRIVLGTPTAAPPTGLSRDYPDTLPVDDQGRRCNIGGRRHYCANSPTYRECTRRIVEAVGDAIADIPFSSVGRLTMNGAEAIRVAVTARTARWLSAPSSSSVMEPGCA